MKKNREADDIYDTWRVCGNFKGEKLYADTSALRALRAFNLILIGRVTVSLLKHIENPAQGAV